MLKIFQGYHPPPKVSKYLFLGCAQVVPRVELMASNWAIICN